MLFPEILVLMRGGGDLATGVALRLFRAGFPLAITELQRPLTVRRKVAFASAVLEGRVEIEGIQAEHVKTPAETRQKIAAGLIPVLIDPQGVSARELQPRILVDARMTKRNSDTHHGDAPLVIAMGPGFTAGVDCDAVIETNRGHFLGRVYWQGQVEPDTGTPDAVQGVHFERVLRAPRSGVVRAFVEIGQTVRRGQVVAIVGGEHVLAAFDGTVRGMIADGAEVPAKLKIGDLDPRNCREYCFTVSDKALAIGGGVLEAALTWLNRNQDEQQNPPLASPPP